MFRSIKSLTYTKCENLVRDLTADSDAKPDQKQLAELANFTINGTKEQYTKILAMISKRMTDYPKIKHVKKALMVIDYGLNHFSDKFVSDIAQQQSVIQRITKYRYYKNGETDIAGPVRELAASILIKLSSDNVEASRGTRKAKVAEPAASSSQPQQQQQQQEEEVNAAAVQNKYKEVQATEAQENAVKFDTFDSGSVEIKGRVGFNEGRVNGIYAPRPEEDNVGGKTSYKKEGQMDNPIILWYWTKNQGVWMISRENRVNSDQAYACVRTGEEADTPDQIKAGKTWMIYNPGKGAYEKDTNITVSKV